MPVSVYFIGDETDRIAARNVPAVFVSRAGGYAQLETAITGRRAFLAIGDPTLFGRVDGYLCEHGLYEKGSVTIMDEGDGVCLGDFSDMIVFLTDDLEFARRVKRGSS